MRSNLIWSSLHLLGGRLSLTFWLLACDLRLLDDTSACDLRFSVVFFVELNRVIDVGVAFPEDHADPKDPEDPADPKDPEDLEDPKELERSRLACLAIIASLL